MADNANSKRILLINDMAGYGKVALAAMIPILSSARHQVFNLPTALVSNTLDYGTFDILETTGYMRGGIDAWEKLGFEFDAVATGFFGERGADEARRRLLPRTARDGSHRLRRSDHGRRGLALQRHDRGDRRIHA